SAVHTKTQQKKNKYTHRDTAAHPTKKKAPRQYQSVPHRHLCHVESPVSRLRSSPGDMRPPVPPAGAWTRVPHRSCTGQTERSRPPSVRWCPCPDLGTSLVPDMRLQLSGGRPESRDRSRCPVSATAAPLRRRAFRC